MSYQETNARIYKLEVEMEELKKHNKSWKNTDSLREEFYEGLKKIHSGEKLERKDNQNGK